ncbi:MAG: ABC transporter permease [Pseudomonadota bacterium]
MRAAGNPVIEGVATDMAASQAAGEEKLAARAGRSNPFLLMPITLFFALLMLASLRSPSLMTSFGIGSAIIVVAPLMLATFALMASVIAGRVTVDLSIGPLIGFINVTLIQLHGLGIIGSPITVFLYAIAAGALYQFIFALIVIYVRVQPIIVSLSGFLALSGINLVILPRPGGLAPEFMQEWGFGITIFSPILFIVLAAIALWLLFTATAFYTHLRLMGSDERAAYTSGVPIVPVRIGAHLISGAFAGLAAICFTALISSGDPSQGTTYTLIAVTALVLGGASLAGGRAGIFGSALGALNLYLITFVLSTFNFGAVQSFVTDLAYGSILVISLLLTLLVPFIQRRIPNFSPLLYFVVFSVVSVGVILHSGFNYRGLPEVGAQIATEQVATEQLSEETAPAAISPPGPLALPAALNGPLEVGAVDAETQALRDLAGPLVLSAILLIVIAVFLRITIAEAGQRRNIGMGVGVVAAGLVLLIAWFMTQANAGSVHANPPALTTIHGAAAEDAPHEVSLQEATR